MLVFHTQQHILKHIKIVTVFGICYRICYALCYRLSGPLQGKVKLFFVIIIFSKCNGMICFFFLRISILLFFYFHRYWNIVRHYTPYSLGNKTLVTKMDVLLFISSQNSTWQLNCVKLCNSIQAFPFEINLRKEKWLVILIYWLPSQISEFFLNILTNIIDYFKNFLKIIWDNVFKNGASNICGRLTLKNLNGYGVLKQTISLQTLPYPFKLFKGFLRQMLLAPFLNTLSHIIIGDFIIWGQVTPF